MRKRIAFNDKQLIRPSLIHSPVDATPKQEEEEEEGGYVSREQSGGAKKRTRANLADKIDCPVGLHETLVRPHVATFTDAQQPLTDAE